MGMHIDHRGGYVNPIALNREVVLCYSSRQDDRISIYNMDEKYGNREITMSHLQPDSMINSVDEWLAWTQRETEQRIQTGTNQDWVQKLNAPVVYLQVRHPERSWRGFDGVLESSLPPRMGLSSSSAIIVTIMDVLLQLNNNTLSDDQFVSYCGTAEWYVGTRGGFGDQAAIKFGRYGMITHMKTLPTLKIHSYLPFPEEYQLLIFDSGQEADKTGPAGGKFNARTATYEIGELFIREYMMQNHLKIYQSVTSTRKSDEGTGKRFFLADVEESLSESQISALLEVLPDRVSRSELNRRFPEQREFLQSQFDTHEGPDDGYPVRAVITYGICECRRSRKLSDIINNSRIKLFGHLMNVSHDGDRVSGRFSNHRDSQLNTTSVSDLLLEPGGYGCSIPEIDIMVDLALDAGAEGAQIMGAGLGGSILVLVNNKNVENIIETMQNLYYGPRHIEENTIITHPIEGASFL